MCSTGGGAEPWQALRSAAAGLAAQDVTSWSDEQVRDGLLSLLTVANQLTAVISTVSASFDTRGLAEHDGFRTARSWLIAFGRMSQGAASGWLSRGRLLAQLPALSAAAHTGAVSAEQIRTVADLVGHVGIDAVQPLDEILAGVAATAGPGEVAQACERIRAHVDPDGPDPDPHAGQRRALSISRCGSLFSVSGRLDLEGGATLLTALDSLTRPVTPDDPSTAVQRRADALVELARQALDRGTLPTTGGVRPHLGLLLTPDTLLGLRNATGTPTANAPRANRLVTAERQTAVRERRSAAAPRRSAMALADQAKRAASTADPPPPRPPDALQCAGVPMAPELPWSNWADRLPASVAQRLACDCEVWRVILDPATGLPLEVGRAHRIVPTWMRKALIARDRGCRWPGCTAPASWCEVHHLLAWYHGGLSNVDNGVLMCRWHHGKVHDGLPDHQRWRIVLDPTTGDVTVSRPGGEPYELAPTQPYRHPAEATRPEARA